MSIPNLPSVLEWGGAVLGLAGSALLAANTRHSGWGFVAYLLSNACWIGFALHGDAFGLLTMQIGFTLTSALGIYRWLLSRRPTLSDTKNTSELPSTGGQL